jgi:hypothetical protein
VYRIAIFTTQESLNTVIMRLNHLLEQPLPEANVIGSAVRLDEIPPHYRKLPFLGRGATTLAFAKDADTALIFTRDSMKAEWLMHGLHMAQHREEIKPARAHHIPGMSMYPLVMIEMPRLYPLSPSNARLVTQEVREFQKLLWDARAKAPGKHGYGVDLTQMIRQLSLDYQRDRPNSLITPLIDWLINYDSSQYRLDVGRRQFKQTRDGQIVLLDPVVSSELLDLLASVKI